MEDVSTSAQWNVKLTVCCLSCQSWQDVNFYSFGIKALSYHPDCNFDINCKHCYKPIIITHINKQ